MAANPEREGIHTVEVSKTAVTIVVGLVLAICGGFAKSYFDLSRSNVVLGEQVAQLKLWAAGTENNRCTANQCQAIRDDITRLRARMMQLEADQRQHEKEAGVWMQRIVVCEFQVKDCIACKLNFGIKDGAR